MQAACSAAVSFAHALSRGLTQVAENESLPMGGAASRANALMAVSHRMRLHNTSLQEPVLAKSQMCIWHAVLSGAYNILLVKQC